MSATAQSKSRRIKIRGSFFMDKMYTLSAWDEKNNPYLMKWIGQFTTKLDLDNPKAAIERLRLRGNLIPQYAFAIPDLKALKLIAKYSPDGVLEIGAGSGYWASLLTKLGCDVIAYDSRDRKYNHDYQTPTRFESLFFDIIEKDGITAIKTESHKRTLMFVWPDYATDWPFKVLKAYKGNTVIYVGEQGGCTADEDFEKELEKHWNLVDSYSIPQWDGLHDAMFIYRR